MKKMNEEKRHLSFEIDYFHSEVGKGKKHDSNKGLLLHLCLQILHIFQKISNISTCEKLAQEKNTSTNTFLESISRERKREKSGIKSSYLHCITTLFLNILNVV